MTTPIKQLETRALRPFTTETDYQVTMNGRTWIVVLHRYSDGLLLIQHADIKDKFTGHWLDPSSELAAEINTAVNEFITDTQPKEAPANV